MSMMAGMSTAVTAFFPPTTITHAHTRSPHAFFLPLPSLRDVDWSWWWHLQTCQQHQLWSWECGVGRNQAVQDFLGDVVHPWGGGEPNGRNLNLTPKLTQLPHGKPGQQWGRGPRDGGTSLPLTWWTTGQQDRPNAYVANPTTTWSAQRLCGKTTTAGVTCTWWPPWWQDHWTSTATG